MTEIKKILEKLYRDPSQISSLDGIERFYKKARKSVPDLSREQVQKFLQTKETYTRHKPVREKFKREKTVVVDIQDLYQSEFIVISLFSEFYDNYKFCSMVVDCISRFGFAVPIYSKKPTEIVGALSIVFKRGGIGLKIWFDSGVRYENGTLKNFLRKLGVVFYYTRNDAIICSLVEHWNRTIKERLWAYMSQGNGYRYVNALPSVVDSYDYSVYSSTGFAPA